jgi:hypothetical protein
LNGLRFRFARQLLVGDAPSGDLRYHDQESLLIGKAALIETEHLFVQVAEKMNRVKTGIRAAQCALQQASEVLYPVRVNAAIHVLFSVVDDLAAPPQLRNLKR